MIPNLKNEKNGEGEAKRKKKKLCSTFFCYICFGWLYFFFPRGSVRLKADLRCLIVSRVKLEGNNKLVEQHDQSSQIFTISEVLQNLVNKNKLY